MRSIKRRWEVRSSYEGEVMRGEGEGEGEGGRENNDVYNRRIGLYISNKMV